MAASDTQNSLWQHRDFLVLWAAQTISMLGSQVSFLAFPLVASLGLGATPLQMGTLTALGALPALLGLVVGPWADQLPRRFLLVAANLGRAVLLLVVPAAALLGTLRIELLYVVVLISGVLALCFDVGYQALLPALVGRERLVAANSRLELSRATSELAGPALAGGLLQLLAAPLVIVVDACSYLASALLLARIRALPAGPTKSAQQPLWRELTVGLGAIAGNPALRSLVCCTATVNLFNAALETVLFLYVPRELGVSPGLFGLIFVVGSAGALIGAAITEWAIRRVSPQMLLVGGLLIAGLGDLLTPLAAGSLPLVMATLLVGALLFGAGISVYRILVASLRQALTPDALQGRVAATVLALTQGGTLAGALLGGVFGELAGPRATLLLAATGELLAVLWLLPLARRRA